MRVKQAKLIANQLHQMFNEWKYVYEKDLKHTKKQEQVGRVASHIKDAEDYILEVIKNMKEDDNL